MKDIDMKKYDVRYIKLHFELEMTENTEMPVHKVSAIRGGIGEMLLQANCIADRDCEKCDYESECIVQRTMYSKFERELELVSDMNSVGYIIECDDYRKEYTKGDILLFNLLLFGKTIAYFKQYYYAVKSLGEYGIGKNKSKFLINQVYNSRNQPMIEDDGINMNMNTVETIDGYIKYRLEQLEQEGCNNKIVFKTPLTLKHNGKFLDNFDANLIVKAILRRLYILNCYEGNYDNSIAEEDHSSMEVVDENVIHQKVYRYSNRKNSGMHLKGIRGEMTVDNISDDVMPVLLAGEIIHVGKSTSFGFGKYVVK